MGTSVPEVKLNNSLLFSIHNYFIRLCLVSQDKSQSAFKNIQCINLDPSRINIEMNNKIKENVNMQAIKDTFSNSQIKVDNSKEILDNCNTQIKVKIQL